MKQLYKITTEDVCHILEETVRLLKESVDFGPLGDDDERFSLENDFRNNYDWGQVQQEVDDEDEYYQDQLQDPDAYKDDFLSDLGDGDLYR